jgi:hypothetical protein
MPADRKRSAKRKGDKWWTWKPIEPSELDQQLPFDDAEPASGEPETEDTDHG